MNSPRRTVLITGAAKRLGRHMALHLAAQGWHVALHYRNSQPEAEQTLHDCQQCAPQGGRFALFQADLSDETAVRSLWHSVVQTMGEVDAVVNSASTFEHDAPSLFSYAQLEQHMRANTAPAIVLAQQLYEHCTQRQPMPQPAVVVNLLDQKLWNLNPDFFSYTLSKAALHTATTMLAMSLAPRVRVVGVAPGLTLTSHLLKDDEFQALHQLSPLGKSSTPQDVVSTVAFALNNASMTGNTLLVDGGQHLMKFERDFSLMTTQATATTSP